jgi:signal transduction histidine kinase
MRVRRPGLRTRLVLALVATSAVTLAAATFTVVRPLEHRIVDDQLSGMRELARTARLGLERLPARDLRPGAHRQQDIVRQLARRMGGRVALFDANGLEVADTDPGSSRELRSRAREHLVDAGFARAGDLRQQVRDGEAVVVARMYTQAGRRTLVLTKSLDDSRAAAAVVRRALPVAAAVGIALAIALGVALGFGLMRRLERLRREARRLADEGIDQPVALGGARDEVGEVADALESMRARLHAEEHGRQVFLSTASHELRTPLASLQGTVELLEEELESDAPDIDAVRRRAATAHRQTERLTTLATDLLDLGRLDGGAQLAVETVELAELTETIAAEAEAAARAAGVTLVVRESGPAWAKADARAAARIIRVLLDNALRHGARPGGTVTVGVETDGGDVAVRVSDDGPGVPAHERERIFGRFERGAQAGTGFGLGLPIARGLARHMGGDVAAVDAERGACFVATLPGLAQGPVVDGLVGVHQLPVANGHLP